MSKITKLKGMAEKILEEAKKEFNKEAFNEAKEKIKRKLSEIQRMKKALRNCEIELEDIQNEIDDYGPE